MHKFTRVKSNRSESKILYRIKQVFVDFNLGDAINDVCVHGSQTCIRNVAEMCLEVTNQRQLSMLATD